ncbi:Deoxyribonuclease-2-alpha [Trichinella spiralis]|uniref:Deoxyribonuclease-2-alpha n=1 Tax=Trichinella spiralis TaxID=6334 RepID=A0A0V1B551_TRISP|nr:Deoxyribonuclease-2-alpha [Trichinella spiralis]
MTYFPAIVYKAPGQANGKIIEATAAAQDWQDGAQALNNRDQHSFAKALEHVVGDNQNVKFLAYNNAPPGVGNVKTKSNSKGVIILSTTTDSAAWIVHTVPGFPAAKTGYSWPVAENARGHLLICLTISESQINAIGLTIVYKAPGQPNGKIILATAAASWDDGAQALSSDNGHSFASALQHVVRDNGNIKFLAYNNAPPGVANVKTKSNSKGVIILATNADSAAWIVHTVPGFPAAKTGYSWPVAENARGHLLICLTILESQINAIAASLLLVQPLIHYNDIPKTETAAMPYFNKLAEGKIPTLPPFTSRQTIRTQNGAAPVTVHIYSKSETSKYGEHELSFNCLFRIFCSKLFRTFMVGKEKIKPENQRWQFALTILIYLLDLMQSLLNSKIVQNKILLHTFMMKITGRYFGKKLCSDEYKFRAIVYKAPGQDTGKIIFATAAGSWDDGASAFTNNGGHSFAKTLEDVVRNHINIKFLAYNNAPLGVPNILLTCIYAAGVIILSTAADSAAWSVHTVPGFPTARTPYSWPAAENARGHLLIRLTISESQINVIGLASLLLVQPMVHYNNIPETETAGMPYFNKLAGGKIPTLPPFTSRRSFVRKMQEVLECLEIYKKVIVNVLKKTIKVWSRRDSILKEDCRGSQRHIRLIKSPAAIDGHNTNLEADITNWAVSDPGNIFCHIDKPYFKSNQRTSNGSLFNEIAAQVEDCPLTMKSHNIFFYLLFNRGNVLNVLNN